MLVVCIGNASNGGQNENGGLHCERWFWFFEGFGFGFGFGWEGLLKIVLV